MALSAVVFSAGFNISANAQQAGVMTEATADVYQRSQLVRAFAGIDIIYGDSLPDIIASITVASDVSGVGTTYGVASRVLRRENPGDLSGGVGPNEDAVGPNGLLTYNGQEMELGDRFISVSGGVIVATIFPLYRATGGELSFAENTGNPARTTGTGEFFLNDSWEEIPDSDITAARGFVAVQCLPTYVRQTDMTSCACPAGEFDTGTSCRATMANDCTGATPLFANGACVDVCPNNLPEIDTTDGKTCIAATTPTLNCDTGTTREIGGVCECLPAFPERASRTMCRAATTITDPQTQTSGGESEDSKAAKVIGVVGIGMAIFVIANGGLFSDAFAFSPDFGYNINENGYFVQGGGKIEYAADNLRMQWTANQTNENGNFGDFRYVSEAKYKTDLFAATFSESVSGETADYNFALSANLQNGIWKISPIYRLHSEYEKGETETQNTLNLEGILRYNGWTIRPAAGFRWENADNFGENARFRVDAIHRF